MKNLKSCMPEASGSMRFAPGVVNTPMHQPETHEFLKQLSPMKWLAKVEEVADPLLYLEFADFVNGEVVHLDGGHMPASGSRRNPWRSTRVAQQHRDVECKYVSDVELIANSPDRR